MNVPYAAEIQTASQNAGVPASILAGLLAQESSFNPTAKHVNPSGSVDRGIAQINNVAHPSVTNAQAYNPTYAISWAANYLSSLINKCGSVTGGLSAYNTGSCSNTNGIKYAQQVLSLSQEYTSLNSTTSTTSNQLVEGVDVANTNTHSGKTLEDLLTQKSSTSTGILHPVGTAEVILEYAAGIIAGLLLIGVGIWIAARRN